MDPDQRPLINEWRTQMTEDREYAGFAHTADQLPFINFAVALAGAWWTVAELMRRHPGQIRLYETVPIEGGGYWCLTIRRRHHLHLGKLLLHINMAGSNYHLTTFTSDGLRDQFSLSELVLAPDRRESIVKPIESQVGLPTPSETPPTVETTVTYRVMAAFMARAAFAGNSANGTSRTAADLRWRIAAGFVENGYQYELYEPFHEIPAPPDTPGFDPDVMPHTWPDHWFLLHEGKPVAAFDVSNGIVWNGGHRHDLMAKYRQLGRSIDRLVTRVLPPTS